MSQTKQEQVLSQVFAHPISHNLEWRELIAALRSIGTVEEISNGKYHFSRNGRTLTLDEPGTKDVGEEEILRLRRFLDETAGAGPKSGDPLTAIVVVTHDDVSIYLGLANAEASHQEFKPEDLHGFRRHLHHKGQEKDNPLPADEDSYYDAIADALAGAKRIALISSGTGSSSSGNSFMREFRKRHHLVAECIESQITLDIEAMSEQELVAAGREALKRTA
jgi:hypothetical protein